MDWRSAFLAQASSDYQVAALLSENENVPLCHTLHYLQMSLEKFSKGVMTPAGSMSEPAHSHDGATRLIQFLKRISPLTKPFHRVLGMGDVQRKMYLDGLLPEIQFLEQIAPALATRSGTMVNAEYPWLVSASLTVPEYVVAPVHYSFTTITRQSKLPKLLQLVGTIVKSYPS